VYECSFTLSVVCAPNFGDAVILIFKHSTQLEAPSRKTCAVLEERSDGVDASLSNSESWPSAGATEIASEHRAAMTVADTKIFLIMSPISLNRRTKIATEKGKPLYPQAALVARL
jgi:hypothetical protein